MFIGVLYCTLEPLLRGHHNERPTTLEIQLDNVNQNINVLISTPDKRPPCLKGHFSGAKWVASQEGFHCNQFDIFCYEKMMGWGFVNIIFTGCLGSIISHNYKVSTALFLSFLHFNIFKHINPL